MAQNKLLVSFSKKNTDVFEIIEEKRKEENIIISDYICECVRFYEKNHNKGSMEEMVRKIVADMIISGSVSINNASATTEEDNKEEVVEEKGYAALEDITNDVVSFINFDDD